MIAYTPWSARTSPALVELTKITRPKLLDWAIYISPEHKFVYVDNPKVASGTIKTRLASLVDSRIDPENFAPHNRPLVPLLSPPYMRDADLENALFSSDYYRFCFVRNPFTRVLSAYLDKFDLRNADRRIDKIDSLNKWEKKRLNDLIGDRMACLQHLGRRREDWREYIAFEEFISWVENTEWYYCNMHWRRQSDNLLFDNLDYTYVGRFESFEADVDHILSRIFPGVAAEYETSYKSGYATKADARVSSYYTDELCARVRDLYAEDFRKLGYETEPLPA